MIVAEKSKAIAEHSHGKTDETAATVATNGGSSSRRDRAKKNGPDDNLFSDESSVKSTHLGRTAAFVSPIDHVVQQENSRK